MNEAPTFMDGKRFMNCKLLGHEEQQRKDNHLARKKAMSFCDGCSMMVMPDLTSSVSMSEVRCSKYYFKTTNRSRRPTGVININFSS